MSRRRGREAQVDDAATRWRINSKAIVPKLVTNFFNRRMSTAYKSMMFRSRYHGVPVYCEEYWYTFDGYVCSEIRLIQTFDSQEQTIGVAYPDGRVWLVTNFLRVLPQRYHRACIRDYLDKTYGHREPHADGLMYYPKYYIQPPVRIEVPVEPGEGFGEILQREWHV